MPAIPSERLVEYLVGCVDILKINLEGYQKGCRSCYRVLASQLRILLCDRKREHGGWKNTALLTVLYPNARLHPLSTTGVNVVDTEKPPVPVEEWLQQSIKLVSSEEKSIGECIKWVCEKEGGSHVDPESQIDLPDQLIMEPVIVAISQYLAWQLGEIEKGHIHAQPNR
jgi:hypothetical protein